MRFDPTTALIVIDQQRDFEPGGALAVKGGDEIARPIAKLMEKFSTVVVSQDSHPAGHISFASSYIGKQPFGLLSLDEVEKNEVKSLHFSKEEIAAYLKATPKNEQVLWPDHCVVGSDGWQLNPTIDLEKAHLILRKGTRKKCDSYSVFFENDRSPTGLSGYLRERGVKTVFTVGLAGDYCVYWSAKDAISEGFDVLYDEALTRFVGFPEGARETALSDLKKLGVEFRERGDA